MQPIQRLISTCAVLLLAALLACPATAQDRAGFQPPGLAKEAERYEGTLKSNWKPGNKRAAEYRTAADRLLVADPRGAAASYGLAVASDPADADSWIGLARALLAITPSPERSSERYELPNNASAAAWLGYERGKTPALKARALIVLSEAMKRRSNWRPAIDALKTSLALVENAEVRKAYEALKAEKGFRILDHKVDADGTTPRLCVQLSEPLARTQTDFSKFVSVDGRDAPSVIADTRQLCVEGLSHGKRYEVQIRAGLPSEVGEELMRTAEIPVYVRDRAAAVRVTGRAYVLPARGQQGIPLTTVNTERVALEVYRIGDRSLVASVQNGELQRQLHSYDLENLRERTGSLAYKGEMDIASKLNEDVTTAFPVSEAIAKLEPGVYALVARPVTKGSSDNGWATQWFVVSDLGLTAFSGEDGVHGFVRSLASAEPIAGANVRLVAKNNEILGTAKSDASGYVRFAGGLKRGEGGLAPAILVAEGAAGDYAFLDLTTAAFDLSDRGVKGREAPGPIDGFLYAERGVYRPGEDVHLTALIRDKAAKAATLPVTLIVSRPDGVEHRRYALNDQGLGGRSVTLALAGGAQTGTWRAKLYTDPKASPIAQLTFLVEDFVPERLELKLEAAAKAITPEEPGRIQVAGRYLYGPPAANLAVEGEIVVKKSAKDLEGLAGYRFGTAEEKVSPVRKPLENLPSTGADGRVELAVTLPALQKTARPLDADIIVRLREPGGRTIERTVSMPVSLAERRIGIKPLFTDDTVGEGEQAAFDVIMLDERGKTTDASRLAWTLYRLDTTWQWYKRESQWAYEPVTITRRLSGGALDAGADKPGRVAVKTEWGRYRIEVTTPEADGPVTSVDFNAGWYAAEESADTPEMLEVALDKPSYKPGETAKLRIVSKQAGKAMVAVLGGELHTVKQVDVPKGNAEVAIEVSESWGAGAYVAAALYRPLDEKAKRMPSRALGLKWLALDQASRTIGVALEAPQKVKSGATLSIPVKLTGLAAGEEARITVAAVDAGILNLTRYQAPNPQGHFFAQRRLGTEIRDFYGRLIDGMRAERGKLRSGGDGAGGMAMQGNPPVEELVALYSGIVKVGADGTAKVEFKLPEFNGTVRVNAVAWSEGKLGHASQDVIVRDAVALLVSGPRFMTLGDATRIALDVHNIEGPAAAYRIAVEQESAAGLKSSLPAGALDLKPNERKQQNLAVKPEEVGRYVYNVSVNGPGDSAVKRKLTFDVKPPAGDIKRTTVSSLAAKGGKMTLSADLASEMIASRTRINLSVGPGAALDIPGLLTSLDRYPHGCAEQTTSRALPLLYANAVATNIGIAQDKELKERVQKAVDRVFEMQDASGAFGVWGPWSTDMWLTAYVTDFLTRAKEMGVAVRPLGFGQALDKLQGFIAYAQDFEKGGEARAYAIYVLARNGRAPIGEMRYYADTRLDRFSTPLAQAQLGAALAMAGDKERAEKVFRTALEGMGSDDDYKPRSDYGSRLRDSAAIVTLAAETGIARAEAPKLVPVIARAYASRTYTSTQEQAWMLLAANALADQAKNTELTIAGQPVKGQAVRAFKPEELKASPVVVTNEGGGAVDAVVTVIGAALTPEPAVAKGMTVERTFYTLDGKKIDLKSANGGTDTVKQNDRFVVVLKVDAKETGGRILLVDRLPAGFEVENPRLVDGGDVKSLDWLKPTVKPEHTEFRDDRFVAAFNFFGGNGRRARGEDDDDSSGSSHGPVSGATVAYIVRAVTPGSFVHPAATVEDMYRPERYARTAAGRLDVTAKE